MEQTKRCDKCKQHLPLISFVKNKRSADGYHYICKTCIKVYQSSIKDKLKAYQHEYQKEYRKENKEKIAEYNKEWQKNNKEKMREYVKKSNAKRIEAKKIYDKAWRLRKKLEKQQNG